uniref:Uncharacterized protein n=1 Tax=Timema douglasi TaxID=61478 RepID=A0A7R8Z378_TIMDO|nr:unnamed protein product [Timema douglasi]
MRTYIDSPDYDSDPVQQHFTEWEEMLLQQKSAVPRVSVPESFQQGAVTKSTPQLDNWTGGRVQLPPLAHSLPPILQPHTGVAGGAESPGQHDGKHSLLQFAMLHFRQSPEKLNLAVEVNHMRFSSITSGEGGVRGDLIPSLPTYLSLVIS